jgi:hypothetical protein
MFVTIDTADLYVEAKADAVIRGRLAPDQIVPVRGQPIAQDGWIWHRVNIPGKVWIREARTDGTQQLLRWVGVGSKPTVPAPVSQPTPETVPPSVSQPTSEQPTNTETAPQTVPVIDEETRIQWVAFAITARFEGGAYSGCQNYDEGIVSYGRYQFTVTGTLSQVLQNYLDTSASETAKTLAAYLPRVKAREEALRQDEQFKVLLQQAADEPAMRAAQDKIAVEQYWKPLHDDFITPRGIKLPLSRALLFDIAINFGMGDLFVRLCEDQLGVPRSSRIGENSIREEDLMACVAERRKQNHYENAERRNLPGLKVRGDFWVELIAKNDWQLQGDADGVITIKNRPLQVRSLEQIVSTTSAPTETTSNTAAQTPPPAETPVADTSQPLSDSDQPRLKIRGIGPGKSNIRADASQAATVLGSAAPEMILEVLEPIDQARAKVGQAGEWLYVRTPDGIEGYTAAWINMLAEDVPNTELTPPANDPAASLTPQTTDTQASANINVTIAPVTVPIQPITETPPTETPPVDEPRLKIRGKGEKKLRIRAAAVDGAIVDSAEPTDILEVLEPVEQARAKIGTNAWIKVRTPKGIEGYTAAWLYTIVDDETSSADEPAQTPPVLSTTMDTAPAETEATNTVTETTAPPETDAASTTTSDSINTPTALVDPPAETEATNTAPEASEMPPAVDTAPVTDDVQQSTTNTTETSDEQPAPEVNLDVVVAPQPTPPVDPPAETPATETPLPAEAPLKIRAIGPQKPNIRAEANTSAAVVAVAQLTDVLEVIEPDAAAKIGQQGQWVQVRTPDGREGYTAAWLYTIVEDTQ